MKVINTNKGARHCGEAPVDFMYNVEQEILLDDNSKIFVQIQTIPSGEMFYAVNTTSLFANEELADPIEMYPELKKASKSKYYNNFKELDKELDATIKETMEELDDTLYNNGIRFGAQFNSKGLNVYVEAVAHLSKEDKYIYLQIKRVKDNNTYTVTEKSIFMRMEMGDFYPAYFGEKSSVPFVVETDNLDNLGEYEYLKNDFIDMNKMLDEKIAELKNSK